MATRKSARTFTDNSTTSFAKMGDEGIPSSVVNMSGQRSPYTQTVPKKTQGRGASPTGKKVNRGQSMIHEANGPACKIVTTLYKANAASANDTQRNVKYMPPAMGFKGGKSV
jgi:hypothetical protein